VCNLRFDDTNPATEEVEYVESIQPTCAGSASTGASGCYFASDYFEQLYAWAEKLIARARPTSTRSPRGHPRGPRDFHRPGVNSPFRDRTVDENLDLFRRMRAGEFPDGAHVLRAKIDMASRTSTSATR
jgi:glutaminyl-tRNA synthetase